MQSSAHFGSMHTMKLSHVEQTGVPSKQSKEAAGSVGGNKNGHKMT